MASHGVTSRHPLLAAGTASVHLVAHARRASPSPGATVACRTRRPHGQGRWQATAEEEGGSSTAATVSANPSLNNGHERSCPQTSAACLRPPSGQQPSTAKKQPAKQKSASPGNRVNPDALLSVRKQIALAKAYKAYREQARRETWSRVGRCRSIP